MPRALKVCSTPGCHELTPGSFCSVHAPTSTRNHRGITRQARGLGRDHDRMARQLAAVYVACELRLPGCTGRATSPEHRTPRSQGGSPTPDGAACLHCQRAQGAAFARVVR